MSIFERLSKLNLNDHTNVIFEYADGNDVFHYKDNYIEETVASTGTVNALSEVITTIKSTFMTEWGTDIIQEMRDDNLLKDYERGSFTFDQYVGNVITTNFYEYDWLHTDTEHYDYKRGFTTITARVQAPYGEIRKFYETIDQIFLGWTAVVRTSAGTITIES